MKYLNKIEFLKLNNNLGEIFLIQIHKQIVSQLDRLGESMDYLRVTRPEPRSVTPIDGVSTGQGNGKGNASPEVRLFEH